MSRLIELARSAHWKCLSLAGICRSYQRHPPYDDDGRNQRSWCDGATNDAVDGWVEQCGSISAAERLQLNLKNSANHRNEGWTKQWSLLKFPSRQPTRAFKLTWAFYTHEWKSHAVRFTNLFVVQTLGALLREKCILISLEHTRLHCFSCFKRKAKVAELWCGLPKFHRGSEQISVNKVLCFRLKSYETLRDISELDLDWGRGSLFLFQHKRLIFRLLLGNSQDDSFECLHRYCCK